MEKDLKHGAIKRSPIHRYLRRKTYPRVGKAAIPFDWTKGYDVQDTIGAIPIKNQFQSESCGGQAGSYYLEIQRRLLKVPEEISAKSIYAPIAYKGGGTTVTALQKQIGTAGAALESEVPSQPATEQNMTDKTWMTSNQLISDMKRAGYTPVHINLDIDSLAEAIRDYGAVIIEIEGQNNGTWLSPYPLPPSSLNSNPTWFHFMCLVGARTNGGIKQLIALNSWGTSIGDAGKQYFNANYVSKGFLDAFVFVDDSTAIAPTYFWQSWIAWFLRYMS